jgi:hypothetical protein
MLWELLTSTWTRNGLSFGVLYDSYRGASPAETLSGWRVTRPASSADVIIPLCLAQTNSPLPSQALTQSIELWPIERLVEYACNPRKNDAAVDRMCASIREFSFKIPVLARSDGEIVDGHLRLKAARKLGITEIPVILCDEWTPAQVKAFRLMVNRSVTWAD